MDAYLDAAGIGEEKRGPLFRSVDKHRHLTLNAMNRNDVLRMIKRRSKDAGLRAYRKFGTRNFLGFAARS